MPFFREINPQTRRLLERLYRQSRHHQVRQRAHCILLRSQGCTIAQLMNIFQVSRKTIYNWFNAWEERAFVGLYNRPGRGRKPIFDSAQQEQIRVWVEQYPRQLKQVVQKIKDTWGLTVSTKTIKRILKAMKMSWHRFRRRVGGQPDAEEYATKKAQLEELKRLDEAGEIELCYMDESGFCLIPCVPYGWQPLGEYQSIPSQHSPRLNVLGFLNRRNELDAYVSKQSITSNVVIACIDTFFPNPVKRTVIVVDQASIHTSGAIKGKQEEWRERNIELFELPSYCPQLNLIEILWRFIKYEWMEISAYQNWQSLVEYVEKVLRSFGEEYVIDFV